MLSYPLEKKLDVLSSEDVKPTLLDDLLSFCYIGLILAPQIVTFSSKTCTRVVAQKPSRFL